MNMTGFEIVKNGHRGVVVDGIPKKSGPNKGKIEVMWIGGSWTVSAVPQELTIINRGGK